MRAGPLIQSMARRGIKRAMDHLAEQLRNREQIPRPGPDAGGRPCGHQGYPCAAPTAGPVATRNAPISRNATMATTFSVANQNSSSPSRRTETR